MTGQSELEDRPSGWPLAMLGVGLAVGLSVHWVREADWVFAWRFGLTQALILGGWAFALSAARDRWRLPAAFAATLAGLTGLLAVTAIQRFGNDSIGHYESLSPSLVAQGILFALIALTAFQAWQSAGPAEGAERPDAAGWHGITYHKLFGYLWETLLVVAISFCFLGLCWLLLWLFAALFNAVGVATFEDIISESLFAWPVSCAAIALAVHFTRAHERIVAALRSVVFALFSILAPVFLVISVVFLAVLVSGGFTRMASLVSASSTLLVLTGFGLVFVNAVIRDGDAEDRQAKLVRISAPLLAPCLFLFCGFAVYAIALRIDQYGLTPDRVFVAVITGLFALWTLAYLAALLARSGWRRHGRRANVALALITAAVAVVLQTPLADPYRLSAESQYRRLVSGAADATTFDYGFLKFRLGNAGADALARIAEDSGVAPADVVREQLIRLELADQYWKWRMDHKDQATEQQLVALRDPERVRRIPGDLAFPEDFEITLHLGLEACGSDAGLDCLIIAVNLTDSPGPEYLIASFSSAERISLFMVERSETGWRSEYLRDFPHGRETWQSLTAGDFAAVPADHSDLRIGDRVLRLRQSLGAALEVFRTEQRPAEPSSAAD